MFHFIANTAVKAVENTTDVANPLMQDTISQMVADYGQTTSAGAAILLSLMSIEFMIVFYYYMAGNKTGLKHALLQRFFATLVIGTLFFTYSGFASKIRGYVVVADQGIIMNPAAIADAGIKKISPLFDPKSQEHIVNAFLGDKKRTIAPPENANSKRSAAQSTKQALKQETRTLAEKFRAVGVQIKDKVPTISSNALIERLGDAAKDQALRMAALGTFIFLALLTVFAHFYVAAMVFVIGIEFYIIVTITACFIPFGLNKHTSYLATGAINSVIASSVKLAVLGLLLAKVGDPISKMTLSATPDLREMLSLLFSSLLLVFLVKHAPQIAATAFSGAGSGIDLAGLADSGASMIMGVGKKVGGTVARGIGRQSVNSMERRSQQLRRSATQSVKHTQKVGQSAKGAGQSPATSSLSGRAVVSPSYRQKFQGMHAQNQAKRAKHVDPVRPSMPAQTQNLRRAMVDNYANKRKTAAIPAIKKGEGRGVYQIGHERQKGHPVFKNKTVQRAAVVPNIPVPKHMQGAKTQKSEVVGGKLGAKTQQAPAAYSESNYKPTGKFKATLQNKAVPKRTQKMHKPEED